MKRIVGGTLVLCFAVLLQPSNAYKLLGRRWQTPEATFYVNIPGADGLWNRSFEGGMAEWNSRTVFRFSIVRDQYSDPCLSSDERNGVAFKDTLCGDSWGETTLAVTTGRYRIGTGFYVDRDIIFNRNKSWNVYSGPWRSGLGDFRRVAIHELGHAIGLDHEDSVSSIMHTYADDIEVPQPDDIAGVAALYGGATQDTSPPTLTITSQSNEQIVSVNTVTIAGTATDAGTGNSGISSVTVNGLPASGTTASGADVASWSRSIILNTGSNLITVIAIDGSSNRNSTTRTITITFVPPLMITSSSPLNGWTVGMPYNQSLTASGGIPPYTWSVSSGNAPPGLALATSGMLSGTPTSPGTYNFTVRVSDAAGMAVSKVMYMSVVATSSRTAREYHVFPQFADGSFSDGTYFRSTLIVTNTGASTNCTFQLYGLTVGGSGVFTFTVPRAYTFRTSGTQNFQQGYATLRCSSKVEAQVLYSFYEGNGTKISEATVFSSPPATSLAIISDARDGGRLGLAIANDSDQTGSYTIRVYDASGNDIDAPILTLGPRQSRTAFLDELTRLPSGHYGIVDVIASSGTASVIGLRFTGTVFTTIPATSISPTGATTASYHVFPQVADGSFSDGTYFRSMLIINNPGPRTPCKMQLHGITIDGSNVFSFDVPAGYTFRSPGTQSFRQGYATLQCSSPVDAQLLYSFYARGGNELSEATVFSSPASTSLRILSDAREGAQLGLAIANDSDQNATYTITVYDVNGNVIGAPVLTLGPRQSRAAFLDQLTAVPAGHYGVVDVTAGSGIASVIGLRFTGGVFTTIPASLR